MARDFRLALAKHFDQIADADLAAGDEVEQAQPSRVGKGSEERDEIGLRGGSGHSWNYIRLDKYVCAGIDSP